MAKTATAPAERLVAERDGSVMFMSRRANLRLVKEARYDIHNPQGKKIGQNPGQVLVFRDGVLRIPSSGAVTLEDQREGDAEEILEWLRGHRLFQDKDDGFWEITLPAPPISMAETEALLEIVSDQDEARLVEFIEQERAGWAREDLLEMAERYLNKLRERVGGGGA